MPLTATSWFEPSSAFLPYVLEDKYLKGGFKILPDLNTMNSKQHPFSLKKGMLVYVEEDENYYQLKEFTPPAGPAVWELAKFGSIIDQVAQPFFIDAGVLKMNPNSVIPPNGQIGQMLSPKGDGTLEWTDPVSASRSKSTFTAKVTLNQNDDYSFEMQLGKSIMLLKVELNAPDLELLGFPTKQRSELNPYKFISTEELDYDQGVTIKDGGGMEHHRRFSFLANLETPVSDTHYFTIKNLGSTPIVPEVTIYYLKLE